MEINDYYNPYQRYIPTTEIKGFYLVPRYVKETLYLAMSALSLCVEVFVVL